MTYVSDSSASVKWLRIPSARIKYIKTEVVYWLANVKYLRVGVIVS
jgi:hypothetical protein